MEFPLTLMYMTVHFNFFFFFFFFLQMSHFYRNMVIFIYFHTLQIIKFVFLSVIKFVSDMWHVSGSFWFPPPIALTDRHDITKILLKVVLNIITLNLTFHSQHFNLYQITNKLGVISLPPLSDIPFKIFRVFCQSMFDWVRWQRRFGHWCYRFHVGH